MGHNFTKDQAGNSEICDVALLGQICIPPQRESICARGNAELYFSGKGVLMGYWEQKVLQRTSLVHTSPKASMCWDYGARPRPLGGLNYTVALRYCACHSPSAASHVRPNLFCYNIFLCAHKFPIFSFLLKGYELPVSSCYTLSTDSSEVTL